MVTFNTEFAVSIAVLAVLALIIHLKSHVKFIALGLFLGIVLAQTAGVPFIDFLGRNFPFFTTDVGVSLVKLVFLVVPTVVLGINHTVDKKHMGLTREIIFVVVTTFFVLSSLIAIAPENLQYFVVSYSVIGAQIEYFHTWLLVATAGLIVWDSFHHREAALAAKKRKSKSKD